MDLSWEILRHAQKRVRERALTGVRLFQGDAANLPLRGEFSLLYCSSLILYLSDREAESLLRSLFSSSPPESPPLPGFSQPGRAVSLPRGLPRDLPIPPEFQTLLRAGLPLLEVPESHTPFARAYLLQSSSPFASFGSSPYLSSPS